MLKLRQQLFCDIVLIISRKLISWKFNVNLKTCYKKDLNPLWVILNRKKILKFSKEHNSHLDLPVSPERPPFFVGVVGTMVDISEDSK